MLLQAQAHPTQTQDTNMYEMAEEGFEDFNVSKPAPLLASHL